jgi:hypothetical protein
MGSYNPTPDYGHRLLPTIIDERARDDPDHAAFSVPFDDNDLSKGYLDITFAMFKKAIDRLAWFIEQTFGRSDQAETMAYLGTPDFRYHFLQMAAAKTGYQASWLITLRRVLIFLTTQGALQLTFPESRGPPLSDGEDQLQDLPLGFWCRRQRYFIFEANEACRCARTGRSART